MNYRHDFDELLRHDAASSRPWFRAMILRERLFHSAQSHAPADEKPCRHSPRPSVDANLPPALFRSSFKDFTRDTLMLALRACLQSDAEVCFQQHATHFGK